MNTTSFPSYTVPPVPQLPQTAEKPAHALLSASGAHQWMHCTPSARFGEQFPDTTSSFAEEGTLAHAVGEILTRFILGKISEDEFEEKFRILAHSPYFTKEMQDYMERYGDFIHETLEEARFSCDNAFAELEVKLDFSTWVPEGFGTADCIIVAEPTLEIIDLKYGQGVQVVAENNPQMRLYALGVLDRYDLIYDITHVKTTIYQPRVSHKPSTEVLTVEELLEWAETEVQPKAELAYRGEGKFQPSLDACRFCKGKQVCRERSSQYTQICMPFWAKEDKKTALLTVEEAGKILIYASEIRAWLKDLEDLMVSTLENQEPVEGWKLVHGRGKRQYTNSNLAKETLLNAGYPESQILVESLCSVPTLEKKLGKQVVQEVLGEFIETTKGKPTLVVESDSRPSIFAESEVLTDFDD